MGPPEDLTGKSMTDSTPRHQVYAIKHVHHGRLSSAN
jgi:hypothetical protein